MITKFDTSFNSSGKSNVMNLVLLAAVAIGGYYVYTKFIAKPKDDKK